MCVGDGEVGGGGAYLTLILSISKGRVFCDHCVVESAKCLAGKQGYALKGSGRQYTVEPAINSHLQSPVLSGHIAKVMGMWLLF